MTVLARDESYFNKLLHKEHQPGEADPASFLPENSPELQELMEKIPILCCACRGEHFAYVNASLTQITGYSEPELFQMKWWDKFTPEFKELVRERGMARQRG